MMLNACNFIVKFLMQNLFVGHIVCDQVAFACQSDALNLRSEASIIGCLSLLVHVVPNMSDKMLLDVLPASSF